MTTLPAGTPERKALSDEHYQEIVEGSRVDPRYLEGVFSTVTATEALALGFSKLQARDGLLITMTSPEGEVHFQIKPDNPRKKPNKNGTTSIDAERIKYETRSRHDVHIDLPAPTRAYIADCAASGTRPEVLVTEGIKKVYSAITAGVPCIGLTGVWNWGRKKRGPGGAKYGRPELSEDWDDLLRDHEGMRITLLFDADYKSNPQVARALKALADRLQERGAHVYIADLPGPEKGLDDFVVARRADDFRKVIRDARPYDPQALTTYTARDSSRVRDALLAIRATMHRETWKGKAAKTDYSLLSALVEIGYERGKAYARNRKRGVEVSVGVRELAERAGVGSFSTIGRSTARLEEGGYISKATGDHKTGKVTRYILWGDSLLLKQYIGKGEEGGDEILEKPPTTVTVTENFAPHFRWAAPPQSDKDQGRTPSGATGSPMAPLGKDSELYLRRLIDGGGDVPLRTLSEASGVNDTSKVRASLRDLQDAGVISLDPKGTHGARVRLAADWRIRVDERREVGGELAKARRQAARHHNERQAYHANIPTNARAKLKGSERMEEIKREAERREEKGARRLSPLAAVLGDYFEHSPGKVIERPENLARTVRTLRLYPKEVTPADIGAAIEELGGDDYKLRRLEVVRTPDHLLYKYRTPLGSIRRSFPTDGEANGEDRAGSPAGREMTRRAEEFVVGMLSRLPNGRVRRTLLEAEWKDAGGSVRHIRRATSNLGCAVVPFEEYGGEMFVFPPEDGLPAVEASPDPAPEALPVPLPDPEPKARKAFNEVPLVDGIYRHGPLCECEVCDYSPASRYARSRLASPPKAKLAV